MKKKINYIKPQLLNYLKLKRTVKIICNNSLLYFKYKLFTIGIDKKILINTKYY